MALIFVALIALGLAAVAGAVVAVARAASPQDGVARQVTLAILALLLFAVSAGVGFLVWFLWDFSRNFTF